MTGPGPAPGRPGAGAGPARRPPAILADLGLPDRSRWRRLGGGSICEVWEVDAPAGPLVLKRTPYDPLVEAEGLAALAAAGAPVPAVLGAEPAGERGEGGWLALRRVGGPSDWEGLGRRLAALHRHTGERYGWHRDNLIGPLPQPGGWADDWPGFYAERRLRPHLDAPALPAALRRRLERALDGPLRALLPAHPPASLVHGDLWSGNVVAGRWLIDPAPCYADREYELAFMDCFGGFPGALWSAYTAEWPLEAGWRGRRPALQLYHLLVHVRLFGAAYAGSVAARLDALGW